MYRAFICWSIQENSSKRKPSTGEEEYLKPVRRSSGLSPAQAGLAESKKMNATEKTPDDVIPPPEVKNQVNVSAGIVPLGIVSIQYDAVTFVLGWVTTCWRNAFCSLAFWMFFQWK